MIFRALSAALLLMLLAACGGVGTGADEGDPSVEFVDGSNDSDDAGDSEDTDDSADVDNSEDSGDTLDEDTSEDSGNPISDTVLTAEEYSKRIVNERFDITGAFPSANTIYQSSDESIATVDANGWVEILATGEVTITSSAPNEVSGSSLPKTQSSNSIDLIVKERDFHVKSWVGENDTLLNFNETLFGLTLFTGGGLYCDPFSGENCDTLTSEIISDGDIVDTFSNLNNPGSHQFTFGNNQAASATLSAEKFEVRSGEATIAFDDKLFLVGGYTTGDVNNPREYKNDVWFSRNGDEWFEIAETAEFSPRSGHQLIVHDDRLWLMGGSNGGNMYNDVWVSDDGESWTSVAQSDAFGARTEFELFTLNNVLYISGGYTTSGEQLSDLWRSSDGSNWSAVPNFSLAEASNSPVVVLGEENSQTAYLLGDSIYSSTDGSTWNEMNDAPIFSGFDNREAVYFNDEIWLFAYTFEYFGSRGSKNISRVFKSSDGLDWSLVHGGIYLGNLIAREAKPISFKDRLYIVGGRAEILEYTNEVWSTVDTELWVEHTNGGFYGPRHSHAMTSHNGLLYSTGGVASDNTSVATPYKSDVWTSEDGLNWQLVENEHPTFRARGGHTLLSVSDKLCYVGGIGRLIWGTASGYRDGYTVDNPDPAGSVLHVILFERYGVFGDIACSIDGGKVWHEVVPSTDSYYDERSGAASIYFNNKLWVIGGNFNATYFADVWSTADVSDWDEQLDRFTYGAYFTEFTEATNSAAFGPRTGHAVTVHNGELYLSAGKDENGFYLDDLWKTSDGTNWTLVNADMGDMDKRAYHQMVSFDNKLWIIAGRANYHETLVFEDTTVYEANDIWVSEDNGVTWTEVAEHASFEQRQDFQAVVHNDSLFVAGGTGGDGYVTLQGKDSILNDIWRTEDGINWRAGFYKELELSE